MLAQGSLPHFQAGGFVPRDMIAGLHQGERVVPAGRQEAPAPVVYEQAVNLTVNVQGGNDPKRTAEEVQRTVMGMLPAIKKGLRTA